MPTSLWCWMDILGLCFLARSDCGCWMNSPLLRTYFGSVGKTVLGWLARTRLTYPVNEVLALPEWDGKVCPKNAQSSTST